MAEVKVSKTSFNHKDGKPRRRLVRTKATINGQPYDLRKAAARRRLVRRR